MKGKLYYFSGTGNTKWAAEKFKNLFEFYGGHIELINIEKQEDNILPDGNIVIIGTPVYAGMPPRIFMEFIKRFPEGGGMKCLLYTTQGSEAASAASELGRIMTEKGYVVAMQASIRMPSSFYFQKPKHNISENDIENILSNACKKIKELVKSIVMEKQVIEKSSSLKTLVEKLINRKFNSKLHMISKRISATQNCNKCGLCLRNCPKGNVTFENGQAVFHTNCMLCLRCIHICPINAITYDGRIIKQTQKDIMKNLEII